MDEESIRALKRHNEQRGKERTTAKRALNCLTVPWMKIEDAALEDPLILLNETGAVNVMLAALPSDNHRSLLKKEGWTHFIPFPPLP